MSQLILASASVRRKELLTQMGLTFRVAAMDIDESVILGEEPSTYVERLAREKALSALQSHPEMVVLAADTTVVINNQILGKPENSEDATKMLRLLSGSTHQVLTGIALASQHQDGTRIESRVVATDVVFCRLSDTIINKYVQSGEPFGKAGAYGIQGKAALFVKHISGSYSNVVGLPIAETGQLLNQFGIELWP